ncbi:MAG: RidA family protein [Chloroflexi bacterium]|nr:RidA family protein [Chloroflexota bacterium]
MEKQKFLAGFEWEDWYGYSQAVKCGGMIFLSGQVGVGSGRKVVEGGPKAQARQAIINLGKVLKRFGATLDDVVMTTAYLTNMAHAHEVGEAHQEFFKDAQPACTMVEVKALALPDALLEIQAIAMVDSG